MERIVVIIVVLVGVFIILYTKKEPHIQSTWIWDTREFQSNQQAYLDLIEKKGLTKLYVPIRSDDNRSEFKRYLYFCDRWGKRMGLSMPMN